MIELTKRELQIMDILWKLEKGFIRDVMEGFPEPKPHYNTLATLIKILVKKGAVYSEKIGNMHQYTPAVAFEDYREASLGKIKEKFFENSFPKMLAHFAKKEKMSEEEKEELIRIIKGQNK